jgi:hypothetical protein
MQGGHQPRRWRPGLRCLPEWRSEVSWKMKNAIDEAIHAAYKRHFVSGMYINVMDIPKVFSEAKEAIARGDALDAAIVKLAAKYGIKGAA